MNEYPLHYERFLAAARQHFLVADPAAELPHRDQGDDEIDNRHEHSHHHCPPR